VSYHVTWTIKALWKLAGSLGMTLCFYTLYIYIYIYTHTHILSTCIVVLRKVYAQEQFGVFRNPTHFPLVTILQSLVTIETGHYMRLKKKALSNSLENLLQRMLHFAYWCHENLFHARCRLHRSAVRSLGLNIFMFWGYAIRSNFRLVSSL
jgi:hypothetical protein